MLVNIRLLQSVMNSDSRMEPHLSTLRSSRSGGSLTSGPIPTTILAARRSATGLACGSGANSRLSDRGTNPGHRFAFRLENLGQRNAATAGAAAHQAGPITDVFGPLKNPN